MMRYLLLALVILACNSPTGPPSAIKPADPTPTSPSVVRDSTAAVNVSQMPVHVYGGVWWAMHPVYRDIQLDDGIYIDGTGMNGSRTKRATIAKSDGVYIWIRYYDPSGTGTNQYETFHGVMLVGKYDGYTVASKGGAAWRTTFRHN